MLNNVLHNLFELCFPFHFSLIPTLKFLQFRMQIWPILSPLLSHMMRIAQELFEFLSDPMRTHFPLLSNMICLQLSLEITRKSSILRLSKILNPFDCSDILIICWLSSFLLCNLLSDMREQSCLMKIPSIESSILQQRQQQHPHLLLVFEFSFLPLYRKIKWLCLSSCCW